MSRPPSRIGALGAAIAALAPAAAAQSPVAGSESFVLVSRGVSTAGGQLASESYRTDANLGVAREVEPTSSSNYVLSGALVTIEPELGPGLPIVLAVQPMFGAKEGGEPVSVLGVNLAAPGTPLVSFGGAPVAGPAVVSNSRIDVFTPPGVNPAGNPKGGVPVSVQTPFGFGAKKDGFVYTPAIGLFAPPAVGGELAVRFKGAAGSFAILAMGQLTPGLSVPLPGFQGALEVVLGMQLLTDLVPVPTGELEVSIPLPDDPGLEGLSLGLQMAALTSLAPFHGSFTNPLLVTFVAGS